MRAQVVLKTPVFLFQVAHRLGILYDGGQLAAVADDAFVLRQFVQFFLA